MLWDALIGLDGAEASGGDNKRIDDRFQPITNKGNGQLPGGIWEHAFASPHNQVAPGHPSKSQSNQESFKNPAGSH